MALHNDATYAMSMEGANELCKRLEWALGIHDGFSGNFLQCGEEKVYCSRRLQLWDENERYIKMRKQIDNNNALKDPPNCKGPAKQQPYPLEKRTTNKKMLEKEIH